MFIWQAIEFCIIVVIFILIVTQITLPPLIGKPFFWAFRKSHKAVREAEIERSDVENISQSQKIQEETQEILNEIKKRKKKRIMKQ